MKQKVKISIALVACVLSLCLSASPSFADEILWEKKLPSGFIVNTGVDAQTVTSTSRLYGVGYYINKSNPDALIAQIIMDQPLSESPLSEEKKITGGLWIYSKTPYCINNEDCDQVLQVDLPTTESLREIFEGVAVNPIQYGNGKFENFKASDCESPVRMIQNLSGRGIYEITLSISCLKIPKSFYSYAYMSEDIGLSKKVFNFTNRDSVEYPFFELAQKNFDTRGGVQAHNTLVAAEGVNNFATRIASEVSKSIVKTQVKVKKLQKQGKKSLATKVNTKNKQLQVEVKKLNSLQSKLNPFIYTPDLKTRVLGVIEEIRKITDINIELLRLDLESKP
jgi:hypothetical protein